MSVEHSGAVAKDYRTEACRPPRPLLPRGPVASKPESGGPRHLGLIVDPLVSDSGPLADEGSPPTAAPTADEPAPDEALDAPGDEPGPAAADRDPIARGGSVSTRAAPRRGAAVRELLLAKAAEAQRKAAPLAGLDEIGSSDPELADRASDELDLVGAGPRRPPAAPVLRRARLQLSPNMLALFGTLSGLATIASIIALAVHLDPRKVGVLPAPAGSVEEPAVVEQPPAAAEAEKPAVRPKRVKLPGPWRIADAKADSSLRIIEGTIGTAAFLRAIQDAGLEKKEAYRALIALKGLKDLDHCDRSDKFVALVERATKRLKAFEYIDSKEEIYQAREGADGLLKGQKLDLKVMRAQVKGAVVYTGGAFDASVAQSPFEPSLDRVLNEALDGHLSIEELKPGDALRLVAQEVTVLGEFSRYAGIETLEVRFASSGEAPLRLYYFKSGGIGAYYDGRGRAPYEGGWRKPIKDAPITSPFNPNRMHPVLKKVMPHTGTDFGAPTGTPVGSSSYGTVSFIGYAGPSGNLVKVDHPGGIETGYAHLSRFAEGLKVGDKVKRLQVVGYVGSTGRSTGPHLHFTAKKDGKFINPVSLNLDGMRVVSSAERPAFEEARRKYDAMLDAIELPAPPAPEAAPSAPEPAEDPALEQEGPETAPAAATATERASTPSAPAPAPATATPTTPTQMPVYLTDKDLLKLQGASDDGEVEQ